MDSNIKTWHSPPHIMKEDFAETVAQYVLSSGGRNQPKIRRDNHHSFALLDKILGVHESWVWFEFMSAGIENPTTPKESN